MRNDITNWPDLPETAAQLGLPEAEITRLVRRKLLRRRTRRIHGVAVTVIDPASIEEFRRRPPAPPENELIPAPPLSPAPLSFHVNGLEAAFLALLQNLQATRATPPQAVPIERRIFLSLSEAVEFSGLPAAFLRKLIAEGDLKSVRTGGGWRIPRAELEALAVKLTTTPTAKEELSPGEIFDLEKNKLRRLGLIP